MHENRSTGVANVVALLGKGGKQLRLQQWRALEEFYKRGHALAIGVSHFCRKHVEEILEIATVKIAVNQVQVSLFTREEVGLIS